MFGVVIRQGFGDFGVLSGFSLSRVVRLGFF